MSRTEALEQYNLALKAGQKYYKNAISAGENPYPPALDDFLDESSLAGRVNLGLVNIPTELIVGTKTAGRSPAMAGNFMPLLDENSEFGIKWISLCASHLSDEGISDPIQCFEYMGKFYVQEGNKRTSVYKSYGAPTVAATVMRLIPGPSEDIEVQVYHEFMNFYQLSGLYIVSFRQLGQYAKLQAELGFDADHVWTDAERRSFSAGFTHFRSAFEKIRGDKGDIWPSEALLVWLQVFSFADIKNSSLSQLEKKLSALWPDVQTQTQNLPIELSTEPVEKEAGFLTKYFGLGTSGRVNAAFIYGFDPLTSAWTRAHEHGRQFMAEQLGERVNACVYNAFDKDFYGAMSRAVEDGAQIIFATMPNMIDACRRIAAEHKNVRVLNCALSQPYTGVRMYYSRIYESKFITGAIAGAMADTDTVGYIENYPIFGVIASINAFALGVRMTNPRARVKLLWSCTSGEPISQFWEQGISVISNRDATNPVNAHWALEWGCYKLHEDGSMLPLAVPCFDWGRFYERVVKAVLEGRWDENAGSRAVNYWWGMDTGVIDVQLSQELPSGVRSLAEILKDGIVRGSIQPFKSRIVDQKGTLRCDGERELSTEEIMEMDWLCDNVDGEIPRFDELLPQSRDVVRLLGIYRKELPPEKEDKQL